MSNIWAIYKRELSNYFFSPLAYVIYVFFLVVCAVFFNFGFAQYHQLSMQYIQMMSFQQGAMAQDLPNYTEFVLLGITGVMTFVLLFVIPMLSMRLLSEEKKLGTFELLMTYPIRDSEVMLGKYFAALTVFLGLLVLSLGYGLLSQIIVPDQTYWPPVLASYLGVFLVGASFLAFGMFASSLTENQIVAGLITFAVLLVLWMIGFVDQLYPDNILATICDHISVFAHFERFSQGVIDTADVAYYVLFTVFFLFFTLRVMESHRWRG